MLHAIIIAGGSGKRLWPKSRSGNPKFLLKIQGKKSLLEQAVDRARQIMPIGNILIITGRRHVGPIRKKLPNFPKKNIIAEPVSRNTAPAVCLGAALIQKRDPNSVIYVMPADQIIENSNAITEVFKLSALISRIKDSIVTIGIDPGFASTAYGYIKTAKLYKSLTTGTRYDVFQVGRFTEKPNAKQAKKFIETKKYLWNSGMFIAKADILLNEFKGYCPKIYKAAVKISQVKGEKNLNSALGRYYKNFPDISIDYAIMEKTKKALVVKADPGWSDIGSWNVFQKYLSIDKNKNAIGAKHIGIKTARSIVIGEDRHLIATIGVSDLVIVQTKDSTLICLKGCCEDVKKIAELAGRQGLEGYL